MFAYRSAGVAVAAMLALAQPAGAQEQRAEVIHWWTSGGESAAVKVFADQFQAAGGTWVDTAIAGGANARTAAINRTVGGNPPAAMQFNTGKQFDELVENDLLANVDAQAAAQNWKAILAAVIPRGGHAQRLSRICSAGEHPWPELAVLLQRRTGQGGRAAAQQLE